MTKKDIVFNYLLENSNKNGEIRITNSTKLIKFDTSIIRYLYIQYTYIISSNRNIYIEQK